jgi:DNA-directed RNA polymerase specialized sigma24 family protein
MARGSKRRGDKSNEPVSSHEKIARLLGILAVKGIGQKTEQVTLLRSVGFDVPEVAAMLGITENHVKVAAHAGRQRRKGRGARRKK